MKIIVTGGAGFIGSHLVEGLVNDGHEVIVIDNFSTGKRENLSKVKGKFMLHELSLDLNIVWENFKGLDDIDYIFHLAALPRVGRSVDNPIETHIANVNGTLSILELARLKKVKKFIYASSSSVYGNHKREDLPFRESTYCSPENPYATQKLIGEEYCRVYKKVYKLKTFCMRFFNVYGSRMATEGAYKLVFGNWIEQVKAGKRLTIYGDGEQTRDFTHVDDVVNALYKIMNDGKHTGNYNVCSGKETSINDLAKLFNWGVEYIDNPRPQEERFKRGSNSKMDHTVNWKPMVDLETGIRRLQQDYGI